MKSKLRLLSICLLLCSVMLLFIGCDKAPKAAGDSGGAAPADKTSNSAREVVQLTYSGWGSPSEKNVTEKAIQKFNDNNPNIKVTYMHVPTDYVTKMATLAAANQLPDVFMFYKNNTVEWGEQGKLYNLKEFLDNDPDIDESKLIPNALLRIDENTIVGTKICEEAFALYYNVDMFKEAGVEPPPTKAEDAWDWDTFVEVCKKLTIDENGNNALSPDFNKDRIKQYGVRFHRWMWSLFFDSNQTSIVKPDKSGLNLSDPAAAEAVQKLADLINVHHVAPTVTSEKNLPAPATAMQSKKVAMNIDGQWVNVDLADAGLNFDVGVLPKMKVPSTVQFGEAIVMSGQTKHKEEAWTLLKWIINPEASVEIYSSGLWMPTVKEWYTNPELLEKWAYVKPGHSDGFKSAVVDTVLNYGYNNYGYWLKNAAEIETIITPELDDVWIGEKTAAEAFKEIESQLAEKYQGVYE